MLVSLITTDQPDHRRRHQRGTDTDDDRSEPADTMIDPLSAVLLVVIALSVPAVGYLMPQDPAVVRLISAIHQRRQHRHLRRWVERQHQDQ